MVICTGLGMQIQKLIFNLNKPQLYTQIAELKNENDYLQNEIKMLLELMDSTPIIKSKDAAGKKRTIDDAMNDLLKKEGVYDNDPDDIGGETIYGITRKYNPKNEIWKHLDTLKEELAKHQNVEINELTESLIASNIKANLNFKNLAIKYYKSEWKRLNIDSIRYFPLAEYLFDMVINNGEPQTVMIWSMALNAINRPRVGSDIRYDDSDELTFNEKLIDYSNKFYSRGKCYKLLKLIKILRANRYITIADKRHKNRKFLNGWLKRVSLVSY